ncbi:hypothetical protein PF003_g17884 [Phytophthora fragariae]|nr:hypothetical protein PF003_g17884 [Phytophthora fragariae]
MLQRLLLGKPLEQTKLCWQLRFRKHLIRKVDPPNSTTRVQLHADGMRVPFVVAIVHELGQIEPQLVPPAVQLQRQQSDLRVDDAFLLERGEAEASS